MDYQNLLLEKRDGIAILTVNRPDKLNALDGRTIDEVDLAFTALRGDPEVGGVILTGSGEKAFVAGADIRELSNQSPVQGQERSVGGQKVLDKIENLGKPVIAAVNGFALGGGCEPPPARHLSGASRKARLGPPPAQPRVPLGAGGAPPPRGPVGGGRRPRDRPDR